MTAYDMRISDWSSDVCSSDLVDGQRGAPAPDDGRWPMPGAPSFSLLARIGPAFYPIGKDDTFEARNEGVLRLWFNDDSPGANSDRKSVVSGKSVSVSVDLGGRCNIKQKNKHNIITSLM